METTQAPYSAYIGFDVSKDSVTAYHSQTRKTETIKNNRTALRRYVRRLEVGCLAVCEPTGGYEALLLEILLAAGVATHRADARRVKAFIRSLGIQAKTDSIDARALAAYAAERHARLTLWQGRNVHHAELKAMVARRQELIGLRTAEKNRRMAPVATPSVKASCNRLLAIISTEIKQIEAAINTLIQTEDSLRKKWKILTGVTGIGSVVAASLLATMPELGTLTRRQAAAIAGVAPHPKQSGRSNGYRRTTGGRPEVKRTLFMAALVASKHSPDARAFYTRLIDNGKKPIVALTALMRKIVTILNAKIRDHYKLIQVS